MLWGMAGYSGEPFTTSYTCCGEWHDIPASRSHRHTHVVGNGRIFELAVHNVIHMLWGMAGYSSEPFTTSYTCCGEWQDILACRSQCRTHVVGNGRIF
jgi:hypothetical protein